MRRKTALLSTFVCVVVAGAGATPDNWEDVLARYSPLEKPQNATIVHINMYIRSLRNVDSSEHTFQAQLTFRQKWNEPRLSHRNDTLPYQTLERSRIWWPDTFFTNEIDGWRHTLTKDNVLVRVYPDGDILTSERLSLTLSCPMNLVSFPFDSQICSIQLASYGTTTDSVIYLWKEGNPVQVTKNLHLANFLLTDFSTDYCTSRTNTGEYSCLRTDLKLERSWEFYLVQVYIPMTMLCIIAWLTFWVSDTSMRTSMLIVTLALAVLGTSALNYSLPRTSYTKLIDWFTGIGLTFIFGALVEFVIVRWMEAKQEKENVAEKIDSACRVSYPIAYGGFILVYFYTGLVGED